MEKCDEIIQSGPNKGKPCTRPARFKVILSDGCYEYNCAVHVRWARKVIDGSVTIEGLNDQGTTS